MKYHRLMCFFYAKFIVILINYQIIKLLEPTFYKRFGKLLSKDKCFKTLSNYFYKIRSALTRSNQKLSKYLDEIGNMLSKNHWLEKRKNRLNYIDIFSIFICISDV
jgi:hypothetical protein